MPVFQEFSMAKIEKVSNLVNRELALYSECSEVMLARYFEPEPGIFIAGKSDKVLLRALDAGYLPLSPLNRREKSCRRLAAT